jgi:ABC-2 type transport system ATP-binding protein
MQQEVYSLLRDARSAGATVFFSSHILREVETLADRVAIIRQGVIVEEARPAELAGMSMRRIRLQFRQAVDPANLTGVPGVRLLSQTDGTQVTLQVEGELEPLIKALASLQVVDLETEHPSLEEVFLAYYEDAEKEAR